MLSLLRQTTDWGALALIAGRQPNDYSGADACYAIPGMRPCAASFGLGSGWCPGFGSGVEALQAHWRRCYFPATPFRSLDSDSHVVSLVGLLVSSLGPVQHRRVPSSHLQRHPAGEFVSVGCDLGRLVCKNPFHSCHNLPPPPFPSHPRVPYALSSLARWSLPP